MNAAVVNTPGQAPKYQSFPDPSLEIGEALVRVRAAGLHPVVKAIASGAHYSAAGAEQKPAVPGIDGVGVLERRSPRLFCLSFASPGEPWPNSPRRHAPSAFPCPITSTTQPPPQSQIPACRPGLLFRIAPLSPPAKPSSSSAQRVSRDSWPFRLPGISEPNGLSPPAETSKRSPPPMSTLSSPLGQPEDAIREAFTAEAANGIDVVVDYLWEPGQPNCFSMPSPRASRPNPPTEPASSKWARALVRRSHCREPFCEASI